MQRQHRRRASGFGVRVTVDDGNTYGDIVLNGNRVTGGANDGIYTSLVSGGLDYYIISDNNCRGNAGTNLNDSAAGANALVTDNLS